MKLLCIIAECALQTVKTKLTAYWRKQFQMWS